MNARRIILATLGLVLVACGSSGSLGDNNGSTPLSTNKQLVVSQGSGALTARDRACGPISYRAAGSVLIGLGVPLTLEQVNNRILGATETAPMAPNNPMPTASQTAYKNARSSFGLADFPNRNGEATQVGTAQLAKMGDLFIQSAPEVLAGFGSSPRCGGVAFGDASGHPTRESMSCLVGQAATTDEVQLASQLMDRAIAQGMTVQQAQELVVAGYMTAKFTCR